MIHNQKSNYVTTSGFTTTESSYVTANSKFTKTSHEPADQLNVIGDKGRCVKKGAGKSLSKIWSHGAALSTAFHLAVRLTHPSRKFVADMVVTTIDRIAANTTAGVKVSYRVSSEIMNATGHKSLTKGSMAMRGLNGLFFTAASNLLLGVTVLPIALGKSLYNIPGSLKTAVTGSVEMARNVGWNRVGECMDDRAEALWLSYAKSDVAIELRNTKHELAKQEKVVNQAAQKAEQERLTQVRDTLAKKEEVLKELETPTPGELTMKSTVGPLVNHFPLNPVAFCSLH